jgi:hypothetical protein
MTIKIINMITAGTDYWFTATAPTAVTDIVIANTDPEWGSGFEWEMHIVPNVAGTAGTKGVNTQILSTVDMNMAAPIVGASPPVVFVGSQIFVNSIGGLSEKWLLDTGDSIIITLDDTTSTGFLGMTMGMPGAPPNTSPNWVDNVIASMDTLSFSAADPLRPPGTYNGVTGISSGMPTFWWGPPVVGTFDIIVDGTGLVTSVTVVDGGTGHEIGDTITIPAAVLGGANDFTMNVATLVDNKATVPCNLFINHIKI